MTNNPQTANGALNCLLHNSLSISFDEKLLFHTDKGTVDFFSKSVQRDDCFVARTDFCQIQLKYLSCGDFVERVCTFVATQPLRFFRVQKVLNFDASVQMVDYKTFPCASLSAFVRQGEVGMFTGFANPFVENSLQGNTLYQSFESALILKAGEEVQLDSDFFGVYPICGDTLLEYTPKTPLATAEQGYVTRYHNPSSDTPLYWTEIRAFQRFAESWLAPSANKFIFEFYMYFSPVKPQPQTEQDLADYFRYIDNFVQLGGDIIVFQPLVRQQLPTDEKPYWTVCEPNSVGEKILKYAQSKNLTCGIYMGSAQDNNEFCNSSMTPYFSSKQKPQWKKTDFLGNLSEENCIACDDFAQWFCTVQKNTLQKYNLGFWNWDPGPGNGHFCHNEAHGHIAGKGGYKGFKNLLKITQSIKQTNNTYLQAFHGVKEYGLWGLKYFDQHEAYWEQDPNFFATVYPDCSADRVTANGMRLQSWWNQNYRFLPAVINHSISNRMIQNCTNPQEYLRHFFDLEGYKFALMSGLAAGASVTSPIIPYSLQGEDMQQYAAFYKQWITWGKNNFKYLQKSVAFGSQPDVVKVDGYARIVEDEGYIFLCNGNPVKSSITFTLDKSLGFYGTGKYCLQAIYPHTYPLWNTHCNCGSFVCGSKVTVEVDPFTVLLLQILPNKWQPLYGVCATTATQNNTLVVEGIVGVEGTSHWATVNGNFDDVIVCGKSLGSMQTGDGFQVSFGDEVFLTEWQNGNQTVTLGNPEISDVCLQKVVFLSDRVRQSLTKHNGWQKYDDIFLQKGNGGNMYFSWSCPHKLFFVLPFADCDNVQCPQLFVNGTVCNLLPVTNWAITCHRTSCFVADITDAVIFDQNNTFQLQLNHLPADTFMGGWLQYVRDDCTQFTVGSTKNSATDRLLSLRKTYTKALDSRDGVSIVSASFDREFFAPHSNVTLFVEVNKPQEEIDKILCNCPITIDGYSQLTMNTDRLLQPISSNVWSVEFIIGDRRLLIIDDNKIHIRVCDKNGFTDDCILLVKWAFN